MSRPPYPHGRASTGREQSGDLSRLDYLPLQYADLLALQEDLAATELGRPPGRRAQEEPDAAGTFMELSALVGHVLSVYQRQRAGEAFISTAQAPSSLVRHAQRLAYDPDPGLAATGYVALIAKAGVQGEIAAPLPLASVPLGDIKAQDYETLDDLAVDDALNELRPLRATRPVNVAASSTQVRLAGTGLGFRTGDEVALVGPVWRGLVITGVGEDERSGTTVVHFDRSVGAAFTAGPPSNPPRLLAQPKAKLQSFGAGADPALYPPASMAAATNAVPGTFPKYWWVVARADGAAYSGNDIYLAETAPTGLSGEYVMRAAGTAFAVYRVTGETDAAVTFHRSVEETFQTQTVRLTPQTNGEFTSTLTPATATQTISSHVSGTVTALRLRDIGGGVPTRAQQPLPAEWRGDWSVDAAIAAREPNVAALSQPLELAGVQRALGPGRPLVLSDLDETRAQVVGVRRVEFDEPAGVTRVWWDAISEAPDAPWMLHDLKIFANVARVSHGRTVSDVLGGSDGVSAFQRFTLASTPVTVLPGAAGGVLQLAVRVDGVLWERVDDFSASAPDDRHYRTVLDENGATTVMFGDGRAGAVPPSGRKNVTVEYRVGLGEAGDVEPRRLSRLGRAHPLVDRVVHVTPVSGGTQPAGPDAIRSQATRFIRTFDRAVSVPDLSDLALTMPGIARAAARWDQTAGAILVVATASGEAPPALDAVRAFLDARRDTSVPLAIRGPQPLDLAVAVELEPDPAYLVELVKTDVRLALHGDSDDAPGMFTFPARGLGQPAYLSEVYQRLEALPGVIGVRVTGFAARSEPGVVDVIPAGVEEWLRLEPADLAVTLAGGSA